MPLHKKVRQQRILYTAQVWRRVEFDARMDIYILYIVIIKQVYSNGPFQFGPT